MANAAASPPPPTQGASALNRINRQDSMDKKPGRKPRIAVVNCGVGNLLCVHSALKRLGASPFEAATRQELAEGQAIILPGVGAFPEAMANLQRLDIAKPLADEVLGKKKPFLGICLGMQLLAESSEEFGMHQGLGWLNAKVTRIPENGVRLPHVGWNTIDGADPGMFSRVPADAHFYFDHSYRMECHAADVAGSCSYGAAITAAVRRDNIWGTQFHPEKSQIYGLMLLRNFLNTVEATTPC
jgi:glutamine amidotransferase